MYTILQKDGFTTFLINPGEIYNIYSEFGFDLYVGAVDQNFSSPGYNLIYSGSNGNFVFKAADFGIVKQSNIYIKSNTAKTFIRKTANQGFTNRVLQNIENSDPYYYYDDPDTIVQVNASLTPIPAKSILKGILLVNNPNNLASGFSLPSAADFDSYDFSKNVFDLNLYFNFSIINIGGNQVNIYGSSDNILTGAPEIAAALLPDIQSASYRMYKGFDEIYHTERMK